ncbi:MAG: glycoside hydrolase family 32 protein [Alistipes sp.]|nr:glycoside hydrolase family 32 protein [Alistipes sp.]
MKQILLTAMAVALAIGAQAQEITLKAKEQYLNIPISHRQGRERMTLKVDGKDERSFNIRIADGEPDYWIFCDISEFKGKQLTLSYPRQSEGLNKIYQAAEIAGQDSLYRERYRPQIHYTQKRGWNNDPNGLIYYEGEYHLFYQHNPYEREWENMTWGHAVSRDLVHWQELTPALHPDHLGTMFSGSAVIDYENTSGFGTKNNPAMVAFYTADGKRQTQCVAYSLDKGRTWTKYEGNPVIDSGEKWETRDTRDPKVFWYAPKGHWVMVLNERDGHSIYNSSDLRNWQFKSHTTGFWECPELFELAVDGNPENKKWVMYGASGTYMIGSFDGERFTPEAGKFCYVRGNIYAAQCYNNIPAENGRTIQVGWGQINHPHLPVNGMMTFPTELTLRTTRNGLRLFSYPVRELSQLQHLQGSWTNLKAEEATARLKPFSKEQALLIKATIRLSHATSAGLGLDGQNIVDYDLNRNTVNGNFYSPEDIGSMELTFDILLDSTSAEVYIDGGAFSCVMERRAHNGSGFNFWGTNIMVKNLEVYTLESIWK